MSLKQAADAAVDQFLTERRSAGVELKEFQFSLSPTEIQQHELQLNAAERELLGPMRRPCLDVVKPNFDKTNDLHNGIIKYDLLKIKKKTKHYLDSDWYWNESTIYFYCRILTCYFLLLLRF